MNDEATDAKEGLIASLGVLATTLIGIVSTRLELLSIDIEEDRANFLSLIILYLVAMFAIVVGLILTIILIVFVLWESHRLLALSLLAGFFLLIGLMALIYALQKLKTKPRLFSSSLSELHKDKSTLESR